MVARDPDPSSRLAKFLKSGLTENQLRSIGHITILWNSIETRFEQLIWLAAGWSDDMGSLVTADMDYLSKYRLASNLVNFRTSDAGVKDYGLATIKLFDSARMARNDVIHGLPVLDKDSTEAIVSQKRSAKKGTGALRKTKHDISQAALDQLIKDLAVLEAAIESNIFQLWFIHLMEIRKMSRKHYAENIEHATYVSIDRVQSVLDRLSRQRSSQHKN
jgi:hypothetical protein